MPYFKPQSCLLDNRILQLKSLLRRDIEEKEGTKSPRKQIQQIKHKNLDQLIKPLVQTFTDLITQKRRKSGQQKVSRRTLIKGGIWITLGMVAGGVSLWLVSSVLRSPRIPLGKLLLTLRHANPVDYLAWSPDGTYIISMSNGTAEGWDAEDGRHILTIYGRSQDVISVAFSPDGKYLGFVREGIVEVWRRETGTLSFTRFGQFGDMVWSPDGKYIALMSKDETVQVWEFDRNHTFIYHGNNGFVSNLAWSPDARRIASTSEDTVQVWYTANGAPVYTYNGHFALVRAVAWSPDGKYIASISTDDTIQVWDAENGDNLYTYFGDLIGEVIVCSPDSKHLAFIGWAGTAEVEKTGTVQILDATDERIIFTYDGHQGGANTVAWSPDGRRIASGGDDGTVQIWGAG